MPNMSFNGPALCFAVQGTNMALEDAVELARSLAK
jgi:2-polyprenyl-6-methoxyphenol hydroxylase-like FAD-dependent oxidoreductase